MWNDINNYIAVIEDKERPNLAHYALDYNKPDWQDISKEKIDFNDLIEQAFICGKNFRVISLKKGFSVILDLDKVFSIVAPIKDSTNILINFKLPNNAINTIGFEPSEIDFVNLIGFLGKH